MIAYAIAGTVNIDFEKEPIGTYFFVYDDNEIHEIIILLFNIIPKGTGINGNPVFLRDIWPLRDEIHTVEEKYVIPAMFEEIYSTIQNGNERWNALQAPEGLLYPWDLESTYIKNPPFFEGMTQVRKCKLGLEFVM